MQTPRETRLIDARVELLEKVWGKDGNAFNHSVFCSVGLPLRSVGSSVRTYERTVGPVSLRLEAGAIPTANGYQEVPLPAGPKARLLLLHLCSQSVKSKSPTVEVADSFTAFARELGLDTGGRSLNALRDQVNRMSVVNMRLSKRLGQSIEAFQAPLFTKFRGELPDNPDQIPLWTSYVEFSNPFYESLQKNAVPLKMDAIAALKHNARALDVYSWLSYRLHRVNAPVKLRWGTLQTQFGRRDQNRLSFKARFKEALDQALYVYPAANVEVVYGGIELRKSDPAVLK